MCLLTSPAANTPTERATVREHIAAYADDDPDIELGLMSMLST